MVTGIKELDRLLGYVPLHDEGHVGSIPLGSVVLLRGEPGSGKTTLGLQIIDRYLQGGRRRAAFVSLESDSRAAVDKSCHKFGFTHLRRDSRTGLVSNLAEVGPAEVDETIETSVIRKKDVTSFCEGLIQCIRAKLRQTAADGRGRTDQILILVDSLLLLTDLMNRHLAEPEFRRALNHIREGVRESLGNAVVIFTAEHHQWTSLFGESFYSDIEIVLAPEPVAGRSHQPSTTISPVGYSFERTQVSDLDAKEPQAIVTRSFCRILKNRFWPNHSRRCAYDIVDDHGIVFYETYPGDGQIVLFAENEPQREVWSDFFLSEIPYRYPAVRFQRFDRSGLQRTFASQRMLRHIPDRTDLYLSSFDTYWVNWFVEFCQRGDIGEMLRKHFPNAEPALARHAPKVTSIIHEHCAQEAKRQPRAGTSGDSTRSAVRKLAWKIEHHLQGAGHKLSTEEGKRLEKAVKEILDHFEKDVSHRGILEPIKKKNLRLFGEHRSGFIDNLNEARPAERRPIHCLRQDFHSDYLLSIPYDANVGLMVFRREALGEWEETRKALREEVLRMVSEDRGELEAFTHSKRFRKLLASEEVSGRVWVPNLDEELAAGEELLASPRKREPSEKPALPSTWEELIALCKAQKRRVLIETQTFDSFTATFLELLWNCGGDLSITPGYRIASKSDTARAMFKVLGYLRRMFLTGILPTDAATDPDYLAKKFGTSGDGLGANPCQDWLFARFWYSTLIDLLTRKRSDASDFVWNQNNARLEIMPIPVSLEHRVRQTRKLRPGRPPVHVSCWGEWHLAVLKGSENRALALDLVNNLMSSQKICERAFRCASLPTVEKFYSLYGETKMFSIPERSAEMLPSMTFGQLRNNIFSFAKSRSQVFDYRHSMREIHAVLEMVRTSPDLSMATIGERILDTLDEIEALSEKNLLQT